MSGEFAAVLAALGFFSTQVLTPGPNVLNTIAVSMAAGRRAGVAAATAVAVGSAWWSVLALAGAAALFAVWPWMEQALALLGGALLILFGLRFVRAGLRAHSGAAALDARLAATPRAAFSQALAIQLSNPKAMTTWLAILALFPAATQSAAAAGALALGAAVIALIGHLGYALCFSTPPAARAFAHAAAPVTAAIGCVFILLGGALLARTVF